MDFQTEYNLFIRSHISRRTGERKRRLKQGNGLAERVFAEKVWWPAFGHFRGLHPEYEISDFRDGYRYIDFAYIQKHFRIAIEIDGLGPHWKNISQWQFSDHLLRQNHLVMDGWHVLRFTALDVDERPRVCQQMLLHLIGRKLGGVTEDLSGLNVIDREIIRFVASSIDPVTPSQVTDYLVISPESTLGHLHRLVDARWLQPASGSVRIRSYKLHPSKDNLQL